LPIVRPGICQQKSICDLSGTSPTNSADSTDELFTAHSTSR
jgi:hypothetical protein